MIYETKQDKFKRLAQLRGGRVLKEIGLLGNLSNRNNYDYSDDDVKKLFNIIDEELKSAKARFKTKKTREIIL